MAYTNAHFGYHPSPALETISSRRPSFLDEDDSAVLDPAILDAEHAEIMQSPDDVNFRKASFANDHGILSPAESQGWDPHYGNGLSVEPHTADGPHGFQQNRRRIVRQIQTHGPAFGHPRPPQAWSYDHGAGNRTPATGVDFIAPPPLPYGTPQYAHHRIDSARGSFSHAPPPPAFHLRQTEPAFIQAPQVQTPMSPHSHQDWMTLAQQETEARSAAKRMRHNSPPRTSVDFQRREGVRKKNGRIDIPQERSIANIDDLLETTTNEDLLKELKQQKRLLRNREAALSSRQRKKRHTEDLEGREKEFTRTIHDLERQVQALELDHQNQDRNNQILHQRFQESQRIIETLHDEKRDMMMKHTEETATLRRRIHILTDQLEAGPAPLMSAAPSSTGFTDFNAEMEALNMGHEWDNFIFVDPMNDDSSNGLLTFETKPEQSRSSPTLTKKSSSGTVVQSPAKKSSDNNYNDQPVANGLLFFLLLCGAFVVSKPASSRPSDLPQVPDDVRDAAPRVLDNLLSDSSTSSTQVNSRASLQACNEPGPSSLPQANTRARSRLDRMHRTLTTPTKQQEIDSAFSLTTAQYASITNMDYQSYSDRPRSGDQDSPPRPRRNLAETLANMQDDRARSSKAEVYTRSLLWDQIPTDVVKQFKEMVRDHDEIEARQQSQGDHDDDMYAFKNES